MLKKTILLVLLFISCAGPAFSYQEEPAYKEEYVKANVLDVRASSSNDTAVRGISQNVTIKITSGKYKGETAKIEHIAAGGMMGRDIVLKKGDKIVVYVNDQPTKAESSSGAPAFNVADYARENPVYLMAFLYVLVLLVFGGMKGLKSLIGLVLTIVIIFAVLFPLTLKGYNPLLVSIIVSAIVSLVVFYIVAGRTRKSLSAAVGTVLGVAIAGLLAFIFGKLAYLSGLSSEESKLLLYSMNIKIDYEGLLFGSILIGALGAVMDVGMSIASSVEEVRKVHLEANFKNLFSCGMNVGRDIMGTMSNTLILAYTGSALPLLLLFFANQISMVKIMNFELVAEESIRALAGSIGLVCCIPITAFVSAFLNSADRKDPRPGL